jgi:hypothetical protein
VALGISDGQRAAILVRQAEGKRLTYAKGKGASAANRELLRLGRRWHSGPRAPNRPRRFPRTSQNEAQLVLFYVEE